MSVTYICGPHGLQNGYVKFEGKIVPNKTVKEISDGIIVTTGETLYGPNEVVFFQDLVPISDDLYKQMYP